MRVPHPIPYQGSKRRIADLIVRCFPAGVETLLEPFAGSAAVSLAAALRNQAKRFWLNDVNAPLMALWDMIINEPERIGKEYANVWRAQEGQERAYYNAVRDEFNRCHAPGHLLFLLTRCVKASVRYNANGDFNQSPDNRRRGTLPSTMFRQITGASILLRGRTTVTAGDYRVALARAGRSDLIYMDPPYQGVCGKRDPRYVQNLAFNEFVEALEELNERRLWYIVSYDGRTGDKAFGRTLPPSLGLTHWEIEVGRSSQATLLGRSDTTFESLYLSPTLSEAVAVRGSARECARPDQPSLFRAFA